MDRRDVDVPLEWAATLDGYVRADVRPQVEGYVLERLYDEGTRVAKGDPLFRIDDRTYREAVDRARADLAQAEAEAARASDRYGRVAPIASTGAVSREEVFAAGAAREAAGAAVVARRALLRDARIALAWATVRAPVAGVAGIRRVEIGDLVTPNDVLTEVAAIDPMRATFAITEEQYLASADLLRALSVGTGPGGPLAPARTPPAGSGDGALTRGTLELVLADGSTYPHPGQVSAVGLGVDPSTGTLSIECIFPNPDLLLRPGQFARIRLRSTAGDDALVVPARAITELQGTPQLAVVDAARGTVDIRTVELGARVDDVAIVREGVREGELVVVEGTQGLSTGTRVEPIDDGRTER